MQDTTRAEHYRFMGMDQFPVGKDLWIGYSGNKRAGKIVSSQIIELLWRCRTFATLDDHAQNLLGANMNGNHAPIHWWQIVQRFLPNHNRGQRRLKEIKQQLQKLADDGLLVAYQDIIKACFKKEFQDLPHQTITSVGIMTCNRVDYLKRALSSYVANAKQFERKQAFIVVDGSEHVHSRKKYRQVLKSLQKSCEGTIYYCGLEEKKQFAKTLIEQGLPPDVVNFSLFDVEQCGNSTGMNRNALLLSTAGDLFFSADDDTVCRIAPAPHFKEGLVFKSGTDPNEWWFYPNRQTGLRAVNFAKRDILSLHETLLGKDVGQCISDFGKDEIDFNQLDVTFFERLASRGGRVLITFNGLIGDSGSRLPTYQFLLNDQSHRRLVHSHAAYCSACTCGEVLRSVNRATVSDAAFCMTGFVGLDNRTLLPPFMPVNRGQDGTFGLTLWTCFTNSCFGHLPWAVLHAPLQSRTFSRDDIWQKALLMRINDLIRMIIRAYKTGPGQFNDAENLRNLGDHLIDLGNMPLDDFEEFIHLLRCQWASNRIVALDHRLNIYRGKPGYWARDVAKYIDVLKGVISARPVPDDLMDGRSIEDARLMSQRLVSRFGQLLTWWPDMIDVAKYLKEKGQGLAKPI